TPVLITSGLCTTANNGSANSPLQGQCMPDVALSSARKNGSYGTGPNGTTACNIGIPQIGGTCPAVQYFDVNAFKAPTNVSTAVTGTGGAGTAQYLIGNAPRTHALNLNNPGTQNIDGAVKRSFPLYREMSFTFEADCSNLWNKVTFSAPSGTWTPGSTTFGAIGGSIANSPRAWQFAGRFSF
ncbi:MAG: TonB-dependent receptor, partial [Terracidiphilus sp.]